MERHITADRGIMVICASHTVLPMHAFEKHNRHVSCAFEVHALAVQYVSNGETCMFHQNTYFTMILSPFNCETYWVLSDVCMSAHYCRPCYRRCRAASAFVINMMVPAANDVMNLVMTFGSSQPWPVHVSNSSSSGSRSGSFGSGAAS